MNNGSRAWAYDPRVNLRALQKSRRRVAAGDIFVALPPDGMYLFGRVITTHAHVTPVLPAVLIYIYRARSGAKVPPSNSEIAPSGLLLPPMMTNRRPWLEGFFETIANRPLGRSDVLPQHCFRDDGRYYDEQGERISEPSKPCGGWGLHSFRTIDDAISEALGIPPSPD